MRLLKQFLDGSVLKATYFDTSTPVHILLKSSPGIHEQQLFDSPILQSAFVDMQAPEIIFPPGQPAKPPYGIPDPLYFDRQAPEFVFPLGQIVKPPPGIPNPMYFDRRAPEFVFRLEIT